MKKIPTRNELDVLRVVKNHLKPICNKNCVECFMNEIAEGHDSCPVDLLIYIADKLRESIIEEFYNKLEEEKNEE